MQNNSTRGNSLTFAITPTTVYISTNPNQSSYANISISVENTGPALNVTSIDITLPSQLAPAGSLASIAPVAGQPTLWSFGPSQINAGEFDAAPQSGQYVVMNNGDTWQFNLNMVTLVSTITQPSATVTASVTLADGSSIPGSRNINIDPAVASLLFFNSQLANINPGQSAILKWQCEQMNYCIISPVDDTHRDEAGSLTVQPDSTTAYTLYVYGDGVILSAQWTITVENPQIISFGGAGGQTSVNYGDSIILDWECNQFTENITLSNNTDVAIPPDLLTNGNTLQKGSVIVGPILAPTIFTFTASGSDPSIYDQKTPTVSINDPAATLTASPDQGVWEQDAVTLQWDITNVTAVSLSPVVVGGPSMTNLSGSVIVNPDSDTTYTLTLIGFNDNIPATKSVVLNVQRVVIIDFSLNSVFVNKGDYNDQGYIAYYLSWDVTAQVANIGTRRITPGAGRTFNKMANIPYTLAAGTLQHPTLYSKTTTVIPEL